MIFIVICLALSGCAGKRLPPPVKVETYTYPDGGKYVGRWKDDKRNGQGTFTYPDGRKYVGEFKSGERNGQGTETYPDGSKYIGEWRNGDMWNGTSYYKNGNIIGKFVNGEWIKQ